MKLDLFKLKVNEIYREMKAKNNIFKSIYEKYKQHYLSKYP
jgi:hypothetical protein